MLAIIAPNRDCSQWVDALHKVDSTIEVVVWPEINPDAKFALCWQPPDKALNALPNLHCVCSMGAGVDALVNNPAIPDDVPIIRLVDHDLKADMNRYIRHCIDSYQLRTHQYKLLKTNRQWQPLPTLSALSIGILGFGAIGQYVAEQLVAAGYEVSAWKNSPEQHPSVRLYSGLEGLKEMLPITNILICILPLTTETTGILNKELFVLLPSGAALIQVGRGPQLNESDLLEALDNGQIDEAYLDVFAQEPLPDTHPFWEHEKIIMTPHIASITKPESVAAQVVESYHAIMAGEPLNDCIDRQRGY